MQGRCTIICIYQEEQTLGAGPSSTSAKHRCRPTSGWRGCCSERLSFEDALGLVLWPLLYTLFPSGIFSQLMALKHHVLLTSNMDPAQNSPDLHSPPQDANSVVAGTMLFASPPSAPRTEPGSGRGWVNTAGTHECLQVN